jgi:AraC-like DNA-binding protein
LLDGLLAQLSLEVQPFAVCDVRGGARLRLRSVPTTLHFVVAGSGTLEVDGQREELQARRLVVTPPRLSHVVRAARESRLESLELPRGAALTHQVAGSGPPGLVLACGTVSASVGGADLFAGLRRCLVVDFSDEPRVGALFDALLRELAEARPGQGKMLEALMLECLVHLLRRLDDLEAQGQLELSWLRVMESPQLSAAVARMLDAPGEPHTLESLARAAGMSRSTFAAQFRDTVGVPAMTFLRRLRLERARQLLLGSELPIKALARRVGFSSRSHFTKAFRLHFGVDPHSLQQAHRDGDA